MTLISGFDVLKLRLCLAGYTMAIVKSAYHVKGLREIKF